MSIKVDHITKLFGTQKALNDVTLYIKPGEVVGLLGPNGAGKSTLMKILTCYIHPSSWDASVCGFDVLEQSIEVRRRVGYLPENNPLYLDLYVKEFLQFIGNIEHRGSQIPDLRSRISEILELTGLQVEQHKQIGTLSRGYRQRVGLAQALLHDPEVLILDEPTSGLDPNQIVEIRNLISQIGLEKTIMMSTHIIQEVEAICNRTIIIHNGEIVADDKTKNLQKIQSSKVIVKVEFDKLVEEKNLKSIHGVKNTISPASRIQDPGSNIYHLESTTEIDIRPAIFQFAVDNGLTVLSLQRDEQKLEEVFQELTKS